MLVKGSWLWKSFWQQTHIDAVVSIQAKVSPPWWRNIDATTTKYIIQKRPKLTKIPVIGKLPLFVLIRLEYERHVWLVSPGSLDVYQRSRSFCFRRIKSTYTDGLFARNGFKLSFLLYRTQLLKPVGIRKCTYLTTVQ